MKIPKLLPLALLFACFFVCSCQKDISREDGFTSNTSSLTADSNYLNKIYSIYDPGVPGSISDTQEITSFHYDNTRRVISTNDSLIMPGGMQHLLSYYYYYNGTDTLPYKSKIIFTSTDLLDTTIRYHFYDAQQRIVKDSSLESGYDIFNASFYSQRNEVCNYSYSANHRYGQTILNDPSLPGTPFYFRDTSVIDMNGNTTVNKKYLLSGSLYNLDNTSEYTYDTHPNPLAKLTLYKANLQFPWDSQESEIGNGGLSKNNVLTNTHYTPGNNYPPDPAEIFTYNPAGYPISEWEDATHADGTLYTYQTLQ